MLRIGNKTISKPIVDIIYDLQKSALENYLPLKPQAVIFKLLAPIKITRAVEKQKLLRVFIQGLLQIS